MSRFIDLTGKRFGRLVVLRLDEEKTKSTGRAFWICRCDCGKEVSVCAYNLRIKRTQSCGCLRVEICSKVHSKSNRIEFDFNYGCLRVYFNNYDEYFLCDIEDRDIAEKYCWRKDNHGYVRTTIPDENGIPHTVFFHRLVMIKYYGNSIENMDIDHINQYKADNRRYNIRLCNRSQNLKNRDYKSNSGLRFIYFDKERQSYQINITNGLRKRVKTLDEAIEIRDNYLKEHPDDFRYNPDEDYRNRNNPNVIQSFTFNN